MKKHIFTLLIVSFFTIQLKAQTTFQKFITANGVLHAGNIKKTGDSGFIVTGNYRVRERASPQYILLAKLDTRAKLQWVRVFGDSIRSFDREILTTCNDGGYAVTGEAYEGGGYSMFVVKFNEAGDLVWSKKITYPVQGYSSMYSTDITETKNGSLLITGETNGSNLGDEFVLSMKSANGNVNWLRAIGTANYKETGYSIHVTDDDGFVVGGTTSPDGGNYFIVKYNGKGVPEWTKTIKSKIVSSSVLYSIVPTLDNGYAFTGITSGDNNNYNVVAVKLNSMHNIEWSKKIQRATYDAGNALIQNKKDSSYFIAGVEDLVGIDFTKGYLIHLNKNGKLLSSSVTTGAGEYAYYTSVIKDRSSIVTAGSSRNKILITKFDDTGNSCNDVDGNDTSSQKFLVTSIDAVYETGNITTDAVIESLPLNEFNIDSHVSVICTSNDNSIAKAAAKDNVITYGAGLFSFKIYPNPLVGNTLNVAIVCSNSSHINLSIMSAEGHLMLLQTMFTLEGSSTHPIDVSSLSKGVYILRVSDGKEQKAIKFIKAG